MDCHRRQKFKNFDAACKERAGKVLDEAGATAERIGISSELVHVPNAHPATAIIETAKANGCDLIVMSVSKLVLVAQSRAAELLRGHH
jgi:nucleotide-binding universal stress UspA family protein